jgi:hypothetical protein
MLRPQNLLLRYFGTFAAVAAALLSGCPHAPLTYQLVRQGSGVLLIPPIQIAISASSVFDFTIKNARRTSTSNDDCDIEDELISLRWQGRTASIRVKSASYFAQPEGGVEGQRHTAMFLYPLQNLEKFRNDLESLEAKNCLSRDESRRLGIALGERLPLPPAAAYRFRFGSFDVTGVFDLGSDFRLQITSPLYSDLANGLAQQTIGYETANYVLTSAQEAERVRISLASVIETDNGKPPIAKSKPRNPLPFPEVSGYFRIVFRTETSASEHITIATLLTATEMKILEEATRQLESGPADACDAVLVPGSTCMIFPPKIGVGPELRVHVNGQESFVPIGGSVSDAIGFNKNLTEIEKTLEVRRLFQGHRIPITFDRTSRDILNFVLMPGDEITW